MLETKVNVSPFSLDGDSSGTVLRDKVTVSSARGRFYCLRSIFGISKEVGFSALGRLTSSQILCFEIF